MNGEHIWYVSLNRADQTDASDGSKGGAAVSVESTRPSQVGLGLKSLCQSQMWVEFVVVCSLLCLQAPVDQKMDSAIHRINHYPVDSAIGFPNSYPLDSNIYPEDSAIQRLNNWGQSFFSGYSGFSLSSKTNIS